MKRRNLINLKKELKSAKGHFAKGIAHFHLAIFHDNNNRELEAIPHYIKALKHDLSRLMRAQALTYLASSYYKVGNSLGALRMIEKSEGLEMPNELRDWTYRLKQRVIRTIN